MKKILFTLFFFLTLVGLKPLSAQNNCWSMRLAGAISNTRVTNMPEYFRNIPAHPDDGGGPTGAIESLYYKSVGMISTDIIYRRETKSRYSWGFALSCEFFSGGFEERNYSNAPGTNQRGFGAALTFAGLKTRGLLSFSFKDATNADANVTPKFIFGIPLRQAKTKLNPQLLLTLGYQNLIAVNGWDRWGEFERHQKKLLMHMIPLDATIRLSAWDMVFEFGPRLFLNIKTAAGKEFGAKNTFAGFYLALGFEREGDN